MATVRNVLVGAGGTGTAFGALMALRRHWDRDLRIVVTDTNPPHLVAASLLADAFRQVPFSTDATFPDILKATIAGERIDTYLPVVDHEIGLASAMLAAGELPAELRLLAPPAWAAALCQDKLAEHEWMMGHGMPTPETRAIGAQIPPGTWFLKRRQGFGGRDARRVTLAHVGELTAEEREHFVLQAVCSEPEVTLDVFHSSRFDLRRIVCRERLETKAGVCTKARIFRDDELESLALRVASLLEIDGGFCMQVMRCEGRWTVTDINPRLGAGTAMSVPLGTDFFAAAFACAWGEDPARFLPLLEGEAFVVRQHADFVTHRAGE